MKQGITASSCRKLGILCSGVAISWGVPVLAQDATGTPAGGGLDEIIVTAQRRVETLQKTPLTITALSGESLTKRQITSVADLAKVSPGVINTQQNGVNRLYIRGIGLTSFAVGADSSSAFHVDGVYIGRPAAQMNSFFDVERIEVVRGPQGTLYGRNATGGSVNLITRRPTTSLEGYFRATYGNYDAYAFEGAISGPIDSNETILARLAFRTSNHDGWSYNTFLDRETEDENAKSVRGQLEFRPSSKLTVRLAGEYTRERDENYAPGAFGPYPGHTLTGEIPGVMPYYEVRHRMTTDMPNKNKRDIYALTGTLNLEIDDEWSVQSITGWRKMKRYNDYDADGTPSDLINFYGFEGAEQVSQEIQLAYNSDKLKAVLGAFYYHEKVEANNSASFENIFGPGRIYRVQGTMDVDAVAGFGQMTYSLTPDLRLTGGIRYSWEKRSTEGSFRGAAATQPLPLSDSKSWDSFTPKIGVDFDIAENLMLYASYTRGFKSGTYNIGQNNPVIDPEKITAYEAGFKSNLFDRRLELNGAVFYYDYTDLQVNKVIGIATQTVNAATAKNKGVELAARGKIGPYLTLNGDVTYLDATFKEFETANPLNVGAGPQDLSGNFLPGAAKWTVNFGAELDIPIASAGSLIIRGDMNYISKRYFTEFNDPVLSQKGVTRYDAFIRYESDGQNWSASVWGKNLTNEDVVANKVIGVGLVGFPIYGAWEAPRTYGVTLGYSF